MKTIVITGMDGAGKTTLIKALSQSFAPQRVTSMHLPHADFVRAALETSGKGTPFGDPWTDRLIFALDNRLVAYKLRELEKTAECDILLLQRGWMDSYVYGAVQGFSYKEITRLVRPVDLPKPDCSVYLTCDPEVAYQRIADDSKADKFETCSFMQKQYYETDRFYRAIGTDPTLHDLFNEPTFCLDTSYLSKEAVQSEVTVFLREQRIL